MPFSFGSRAPGHTEGFYIGTTYFSTSTSSTATSPSGASKSTESGSGTKSAGPFQPMAAKAPNPFGASSSTTSSRRSSSTSAYPPMPTKAPAAFGTPRASSPTTTPSGSSTSSSAPKEPSTTVKFNVGGKIYEIAKSLLKKFPTTKLAKKASSSSPFPIFIDRDPDRFAFCLDYMRDNGKVYLPETVSKMSVLEELKFFGFEDVDDTKICNEKSKQNCVTRFHQVSGMCRERIEDLETEVERLREEAKSLEVKRERREYEIKLEKVLLKCLGASVESACEDTFIVNYQKLGVSNAQNDKYFIKRCSKLGLCIAETQWYSSSSVCLRRKPNTYNQK